jgi:hypothetical protein
MYPKNYITRAQLLYVYLESTVGTAAKAKVIISLSLSVSNWLLVYALLIKLYSFGERGIER